MSEKLMHKTKSEIEKASKAFNVPVEYTYTSTENVIFYAHDVYVLIGCDHRNRGKITAYISAGSDNFAYVVPSQFKSVADIFIECLRCQWYLSAAAILGASTGVQKGASYKSRSTLTFPYFGLDSETELDDCDADAMPQAIQFEVRRGKGLSWQLALEFTDFLGVRVEHCTTPTSVGAFRSAILHMLKCLLARFEATTQRTSVCARKVISAHDNSVPDPLGLQNQGRILT